MKRVIVLFVLIVAGFSYSQAQRYKVTSAWNNLRKNNLKDALEAIEPAKDHKRTKDDAKTWFYRGNIYLAIHMSKEDKFKNLVEGGLDSAYVSYKKAVELDDKDKYKDELTDRMKYVSEQYFNQGVNNYKTKKYDKAMDGFEKAATVNKKYRNTIDTAAYYYAGNSADLAGKPDKALQFYKKAKEYNFDNEQLYASLSRLYSQKGDTAMALDIIQEGMERYPGNFNLIITETNIYLNQGKTEKALDNLKVAVKKDTANPSIWFAVGANYDQLMKEQENDTLKKAMMEEAVNAYKKALQLKPDYYKPAFNLGAIYVNRAAVLQNKANQLPLDETEKFNMMKKRADSMLKQAMPHLEKAHQIKPQDLNTLQSLKEIYARLNKTDKLKEVNGKIQQLTGNAKGKNE